MLSLFLALALQSDGPPIVVRAPPPGTPQTAATMVLEPAAMFIATCDGYGTVAEEEGRDALVDRAELTACVAAAFAAIDTAKAGRLRYIAFADWAERYLGDRNALPSPFEIDRNQDDVITLDELQDQFQRLFARYDKDGSKTVSRAELVTYRTGPIGADGPTQGRGGDRKAPPPPAGGRRPPRP